MLSVLEKRFLTAILFAAVLPTQASKRNPPGHMPQNQQSYEAEGVWSDACPCKIPCPCWRTGQSNVARCINVQMFHVRSGLFQGKDIAGLTFLLVGMPDAEYERPIFDKAYAQSGPGANSFDAVLLQNLFGVQARSGVQVVSNMKVRLEPSFQRADVHGLLQYDVGSPRGHVIQLSHEVGDYLYPWLRDAKQWETRKVSFRLDGSTLSYHGTNSIVGEFRVESSSPTARVTEP